MKPFQPPEYIRHREQGIAKTRKKQTSEVSEVEKPNARSAARPRSAPPLTEDVIYDDASGLGLDGFGDDTGGDCSG